jgi:hypothetical protein
MQNRGAVSRENDTDENDTSIRLSVETLLEVW